MIRKIFLTVAATLVAVTGLFAQELPDDPEVRKGVLDNWMTYYIRQTTNPPIRQNSGFSTMWGHRSEDSQQGLGTSSNMALQRDRELPGQEHD